MRSWQVNGIPAENDDSVTMDNGGKQHRDGLKSQGEQPGQRLDQGGAQVVGKPSTGYPASWSIAEIAAHKAGNTQMLQQLQAERLQAEFLQVSLPPPTPHTHPSPRPFPDKSMPPVCLDSTMGSTLALATCPPVVRVRMLSCHPN